MIDVEQYISSLKDALLASFGTRLVYVGLQGSYLRGEATENSDIDIVAVVDKLAVSDLDKYRCIIQTIGDFDKSCGFICGKEDLANWNPLEIHHLVNGTKDYYGSLKDLVPNYTESDIRNFIKLSLNNMYHEICHRYIHSVNNKNLSKLAGTYKGVFFILQNLYYLNTGMYIATKSEFLPLLDEKNRNVLECGIELSNGVTHDFDESFYLLFNWCQDTLKTL